MPDSEEQKKDLIKSFMDEIIEKDKRIFVSLEMYRRFYNTLNRFIITAMETYKKKIGEMNKVGGRSLKYSILLPRDLIRSFFLDVKNIVPAVAIYPAEMVVGSEMFELPFKEMPERNYELLRFMTTQTRGAMIRDIIGFYEILTKLEDLFSARDLSLSLLNQITSYSLFVVIEKPVQILTRITRPKIDIKTEPGLVRIGRYLAYLKDLVIGGFLEFLRQTYYKLDIIGYIITFLDISFTFEPTYENFVDVSIKIDISVHEFPFKRDESLKQYTFIIKEVPKIIAKLRDDFYNLERPELIMMELKSGEFQQRAHLETYVSYKSLYKILNFFEKNLKIEIPVDHLNEILNEEDKVKRKEKIKKFCLNVLFKDMNKFKKLVLIYNLNFYEKIYNPTLIEILEKIDEELGEKKEGTVYLSSKHIPSELLKEIMETISKSPELRGPEDKGKCPFDPINIWEKVPTWDVSVAERILLKSIGVDFNFIHDVADKTLGETLMELHKLMNKIVKKYEKIRTKGV